MLVLLQTRVPTNNLQLSVADLDQELLPVHSVILTHAWPQQLNGPSKPLARVSAHSEPAASSEAAIRRRSVEDMSGPLCGIPDGTTSKFKWLCIVAPAGKGQNESAIYVSRFTDSRDFLSWLRALCPSGLKTLIKG